MTVNHIVWQLLVFSQSLDELKNSVKQDEIIKSEAQLVNPQISKVVYSKNHNKTVAINDDIHPVYLQEIYN